MSCGQDYVFTSPIAFRGAINGYQGDRTHRSIDFMTLESALYDRPGITSFKKS